MQHPERVFDRLVVRAADRYPFPTNAVAVAILAKKHAVPETLLHPGDLRRQMKNAAREQEPIRPVTPATAAQKESLLPLRHALDLIFGKLYLVTPGLPPSVAEQFLASYTLWKSEIILHLRFPARHRVAGVDHERVALRTPEINCGREPRDPAADDDHLSALRVVEVFVFDHKNTPATIRALILRREARCRFLGMARRFIQPRRPPQASTARCPPSCNHSSFPLPPPNDSSTEGCKPPPARHRWCRCGRGRSQCKRREGGWPRSRIRDRRPAQAHRRQSPFPASPSSCR